VPDADAPESLLLEHGRGIHIMKEWLDELTYFRDGACVYMARKKQPSAAADKIPDSHGANMPCDFLMVQTYDNIVLAKIDKDRLLDSANITSLSESLEALLDRHPRISLILDMSTVGYMSSAMLGKLVSLHKAVKINKGRMALSGIKPAIQPLFKITKLDKLFEMYGDAQEVLMLYKRKPL
jgi:anti-sigma B factor antagonist